MLRCRRFCASILLTIGAVSFVHATPPQFDLSMVKAEDVGMSSERLPRIDAAIQKWIDDHKLAGAVTLIARRGRVVHFAAQGLADIESQRPMQKDTLFHMASCSKPVTSVAILILMEEGKLHLTDPVSKFIPEFKDMKVATTRPSSKPAATKPGTPEIDLVPATRQITIRDLLTHTSGLGSGGAGGKEMAKVINGRKPGDTLADVVPQFAGTPLDFQPGVQFRYSPLAAFETLSRIVEIASGQTYDQFLKVRLFEPLGMHNTYFVVPDDQKPRLATIYRSTPRGLEVMPVPSFANVTTYFSGAGGLTSTAEDYARFAQMLVNGGQLDGHRILSPRTVDLMCTNHDGDMITGQLNRPAGIGFGLGVEVVLDPARAGWRRSVGSYGWDGAFGTIFWVDPKEQMIAVLLVQRPGQDIYRDFENAIEQAIIE